MTKREAAEEIENGLKNLIKGKFSDVAIKLAKKERISVATHQHTL